MPEPKMPRVQRIVLPILRGHDDPLDQISALPELQGAKVGSWVEDIDFRVYPMLNVRRIGGPRNKKRPNRLAYPVIELTAYGNVGLVETEELYDAALDVLYQAQKRQTQTPWGYLHSINENMGMTQFSSRFMDSWRVQGLIKLGIRTPRTT